MERTATLMLSLLRAAALGEARSFVLSAEEVGTILSLARRHDLSHLMAEALAKGSALPEGELGREMANDRLRAVYREARLSHAADRLYAVLRAEGIPYMPLKGALIRAVYPAPWMRTSCDLDLLLHEEDIERAVAAIEAKLGLSRRPRRAYHDVSLYLDDEVHIELHFSLRENCEPMDRVLSRAWEYSSPATEGACRYQPTNEFLLFHHIAHTAYHLMHGGCGVRPLLDLWLMEDNLPYDSDALDALLAEARLLDFAMEARRLAEAWFGAGLHTDLTLRMADYILGGGTYGRLDNRIAVSLAGKSRGRFLLSRIFLPYRTLREYYPALKRHKLLYPFFTVRRWLEVLFTRRRRRNALRELRRGTRLPKETVAEAAVLCRDLGLE